MRRIKTRKKQVTLQGDIRHAYDRLTDSVSRVLIIGDTHAPFTIKGYLEHCRETYARFNCNQVVFIGDVIDNCYPSYHENDPNGHGAGEELKLAVDMIADWYEVFPEAYVTIGNHDANIMRKAFSGGIPQEWIKDFAEVLGTPNWKFVTEVVIDNVRYVHGHKSGKPRTGAKRDMMSVVSGHYHTDMYIDFVFGRHETIFAMAVGCGIDNTSYAMAYGAGGKQPALGCGVVIDGTEPILVPMKR